MVNQRSRIYTFLKKHFDFRRKGARLGLSKGDYFALLRFPGGYSRPTSITFNGAITKFTSPFWFLHSIDEIFIDEVYKFVPSRMDPVIIDCGANIGLSVIYFKQLSPEARIIAFEPDKAIFELLRTNLLQRGLGDVELVNSAVWIQDSVLPFESEGALGGRVLNDESDNRRQCEVRAVRLREYLDGHIDFLKIDIEGAEYEVLKDCRDKLQNVENLFVEYHARPDEDQFLDEILRWLREAGFRYYISEAAVNQPHPFVSKGADVYEMQLNISCYRTAPSTPESP